MRGANGVGQAAVTSTAQLQARVTQSNEEVERLSNENRQLIQSRFDEITNRDGQINVLRQTVTEIEAEIERISG